VRERTAAGGFFLHHRFRRRGNPAAADTDPLMENAMTRNFVIAMAVACAATGAAYADDITVDPHPFVSSASPAQVAEELRQFRMSGVNPWADDYNQLAHRDGKLTRAEVMADFHASRDTVAAFTGEDSGSGYLTNVAAAKAPPSATVIVRVD
jgi:hypothetical protein